MRSIWSAELAAGNLEAVRSYYQNRVNRLIAKPQDLQPITLSQVGSTYEWTFQFADETEAYFLDQNKAAEQGLVDQIAALIIDLQAAGYEVEGMEIRSDLTLGQEALSFGLGVQYGGEFGSVVNLDYRLIDLDNAGEMTTELATIRSGALDVGALALLKGKGIQDRISDLVSLANTEVLMTLVTANFDQDASQVITITLQVK
jgi:hypothetical protein